MDENFCNSNTNTDSVCFSERSQKWLYKWARTAGYTRYEMHYTFMKHWKRLFCRHEVGQTKKSKATLQVLNFDPRHPDDKDIDKEAFSNLCQALRSSDPSLPFCRFVTTCDSELQDTSFIHILSVLWNFVGMSFENSQVICSAAHTGRQMLLVFHDSTHDRLY